MGGVDKERRTHSMWGETNEAIIGRWVPGKSRDGKQGWNANKAVRMKFGAGGGSGWRPDRFDGVWYWQLWRFKAVVAMIDERLNFNQNGAWSIFREVNRLISQALLPSSLSFSSTLSSAHDHFWHQHTICLFPISTSPCSFPPPPYAAHFSPTVIHISATRRRSRQIPLPCSPNYQAYPTIIWRGTWTSKHSVSPFNISQHHPP